MGYDVLHLLSEAKTVDIDRTAIVLPEKADDGGDVHCTDPGGGTAPVALPGRSARGGRVGTRGRPSYRQELGNA